MFDTASKAGIGIANTLQTRNNNVYYVPSIILKFSPGIANKYKHISVLL